MKEQPFTGTACYKRLRRSWMVLRACRNVPLHPAAPLHIDSGRIYTAARGITPTTRRSTRAVSLVLSLFMGPSMRRMILMLAPFRLAVG